MNYFFPFTDTSHHCCLHLRLLDSLFIPHLIVSEMLHHVCFVCCRYDFSLSPVFKTVFFTLANPDLVFVYFRSFQTHSNIIFTTNHCEKMSIPSSIQCRDSNPRPLDHESSPITTRPGLPSSKLFVASKRCCQIVMPNACCNCVMFYTVELRRLVLLTE